MAENPPTVDEVKAYLASKDWGTWVNASEFVSKNAAYGWESKRGPIYDWKALAYQWSVSARGRKSQ